MNGRTITMTRVDSRTVKALCECGFGIGAYVPHDRRDQGIPSVLLAEWVIDHHQCPAALQGIP